MSEERVREIIGDWLRAAHAGPNDDAESLLRHLAIHGLAVTVENAPRPESIADAIELARLNERARFQALLDEWETDEPGNGLLAVMGLRRVLRDGGALVAAVREDGRRSERNAWLKALDDSFLSEVDCRTVRELALAFCGNCGGDAATCDCDES